MPTLYYFHDPMCSWCWGFRPAAQELFARIPENVKHVNVLGGLAPDSDEPMGITMRNQIIGHWHKIEGLIGTRFNYDFWKKCTPRRSTYPACRAVIAASAQGREEQMILAIQRAYYLEARNPSELKTLWSLGKQTGLDVDAFKQTMEAHTTERELQRQISFARSLNITGFPSLVFEDGEKRRLLTVDYLSYKTTLAEVQQLAGVSEQDVGEPGT